MRNYVYCAYMYLEKLYEREQAVLNVTDLVINDLEAQMSTF